MADKGWIKLHRKLLDCWIWKEKPFDKGRAWIDLILLAMHHDTEIVEDGKPYPVNRGSYYFSILKLADRWGWSRNKVKRFLDVLEHENMLYTTRTNKGTLLTIVNYELYQAKDNDSEPTLEPTNEPTIEPADEPQNKNIKNLNNIKNNISMCEINDFFERVWKLYPLKKGKSKVSMTTKKKLFSIGYDRLSKAIQKYIDYVDSVEWLHYQNGVTFFNGTYNDYLDDETEEDVTPAQDSKWQ